MYTPSKLLVTGGAGFIGSWLIRHLMQAFPNCHITNLDLLTYAGNPENLSDLAENPRYRFVQGDICDEVIVNKLMAEADACINVAAQTHVDRSISGPSVFIQTNVLGTQILLEAARQHQIDKFIQISTDEVYGSIDGSAKFSETDPLEPSSPYSSSKAAADLIALSYWKTYGLPVSITRCTNNYGPNQYPEKLIPLFILNAAAEKSVPVYGDGLNVRDWIHVADHSAGVIAVLQQGRSGEVYNIGSGNEYTNLEITRLILKTLGKSEELIQYVPDRPGHDRRYALDCSKIERELGWKAQRSFELGLTETIQWYLDNPSWVAGVRARETQQLSASV